LRVGGGSWGGGGGDGLEGWEGWEGSMKVRHYMTRDQSYSQNTDKVSWRYR
jgi:hypothetical protein